jgi:D-alanyl-D-alanine carboxypeptidase (penicillin-binding protein 5/6)
MSKKIMIRVVSIVLLVVIATGTLLYMRPVAAIEPSQVQPTISQTKAAELPWPSYGQGALGAIGFGVLETHGSQTPVPIASITKVITSLAILEKYPLTQGEQGPVITLSDNDVQIYNDYLAKDGSVAKVAAGEQITEYEALQAVLLPSANNLADSLAIWAFGSMDAYVTYTNSMLAKMGLENTKVADASGFSPQSVSTAKDLVNLGEVAMDNKVISEIAAQRQANIPVAGDIQNVNYLLGSSGIIGIKTGNTDEAGGCYLFAVDHKVGDQNIKIVGAILGAPNLATSMNDSLPVIKAAMDNFETANIAKAGTVVGSYQAPGGSKVSAVIIKDMLLVNWKGQPIKTTLNLQPVSTPALKDAMVGSFIAKAGKKTVSSDVQLAEAIAAPTFMSRVFR